MLVLKPPAGQKTRADELVFAPDGRLAVCPSRGVAVWAALADGARPEVIPLPDGTWAARLAFAPDGRTAFAGNAQLFALDLGTREAARVPIDEWGTLGFGVSPDGTRLVVSEVPRGPTDTRLTCWAVGDYAAPVWQTTTGTHIHQKPALFPPAGDRFVHPENTFDQAARRWRTRVVTRALAGGTILAESDLLPDYPDRLVLSPDGTTTAAVVRERVYAGPVGGNVAAAVANSSKKHFTGIAFHPGGRYLAATSNDATVKLYDTATWELARTFTWDVGRMRSIAFSPDGTLAAAGSDTGKVVVWDVDL